MKVAQADRQAGAPMQVDVLTPAGSWFDTHTDDLVARLKAAGSEVHVFRHHRDLAAGDILFILSYPRIVPRAGLDLHGHNLVVHASDLPQGKGWSPMPWQIIAGQNRIPVTMFEAVEALDAGRICAQRTLEFAGHELVDDLRAQLGTCIVEMCVAFASDPAGVTWRDQSGEESFYAKRTPADSRLDPALPILAQFDLLRTVDNKAYPAFFDYLGHRYVLRIEKTDPDPPNPA